MTIRLNRRIELLELRLIPEQPKCFELTDHQRRCVQPLYEGFMSGKIEPDWHTSAREFGR